MCGITFSSKTKSLIIVCSAVEEEANAMNSGGDNKLKTASNATVPQSSSIAEHFSKTTVPATDSLTRSNLVPQEHIEGRAASVSFSATHSLALSEDSAKVGPALEQDEPQLRQWVSETHNSVIPFSERLLKSSSENRPDEA